ncbi:MAG: hypothetical protein DCC43_14990, partial [Candidatus Brocadia sp.]
MEKNLKKINVFISSPGDVQEERQIAIEVLNRLNNMSHIQNRYVLKPLAYEDIVPATVGKTPQGIVDRYMMEAGKSDIFVCILCKRMGTPVTHEETGEKFASGTEYEFIDAYRSNQKQGMPHILLYRGMKFISPDADTEQLKLVQNFFKRFKGDTAELKGLYKEYETVEELKDIIFKDIDTIIAEHFIKQAGMDIIASPEGRRSDFYQHIPLPANYVIRKELLKEVCNSLLADSLPDLSASEEKCRPIALHGMGGIGKSVIARALCDDPQVQAAFPDGILWTTMGQEPDLLSKLREWLHALGGTISETAPSVDSLKNGLVHLLEKRACLLIVDDIWKRKHAEAFLAGGPRCRLLITTRDTEIAHEIGAEVQPVPLMTSAEALKLLEEWATGALSNTDSGTKEIIVTRLRRLPLAVKLAGAQLKRQKPDEWLQTFDVLKLKSNRPEDAHDSLKLTFELSLNVLENTKRRLYAALSIFKEDEATPEVAIEHLWGALGKINREETAELINDLESRALLEVTQKAEPRTIRLHNLLHLFMHKELGETGSHEAHQALITVYRKTCAGTGWHTALDDGYLYDHLVYHLRAAREVEEIRELFHDQSWLKVRVPQDGYEYDGYLSDLMVAWKGAHDTVRSQIDAGQMPDTFIDCLRYALIRSSINSIAANYAPELVARALELEIWKPDRAVSIAEKVPDVMQRVMLCAAMLKTGKLKQPLIDTVKRMGLADALAIEYERSRAEALAALAPQLTGEQRQEALREGLDAALAIDLEASRVWALVALAPQLTGEQLQEGLAAVLAIWNVQFRAEALAALAPQLTG